MALSLTSTRDNKEEEDAVEGAPSALAPVPINNYSFNAAAMFLSAEVLVEMLASLEREALDHLTAVCARLQALISRHFPAVPLRILERVDIRYGVRLVRVVPAPPPQLSSITVKLRGKYIGILARIHMNSQNTR